MTGAARPRARVWSIVLHFFALLVALAPMPLRLAPALRGGPQEGGQAREEPRPPTPPEAPLPLPPLPKEALPPATRPRPDPARVQFRRPAVHVRVAERIRAADGELADAREPVLEPYLEAYLRRAGHPIAGAPDGAELILEGEFEGRLADTLMILGQPTAWKFRGSASWKVYRRGVAQPLEAYEQPEVFQESVEGPESAALHLRRYMAKLLWDRLIAESETLGSPAVHRLVSRLVQDPPAGEHWSMEDTVLQLADEGLAAVPCLLEALTDTRPIKEEDPSRLEGKIRVNGSLRVYHAADKALEEIFQKVSRMDSSVGPEAMRLRRLVIKGWENEWKRFCPSFREGS